MGSKVELFEQIRRDHRREGLSIRGLADRHGVHRRTVRAALDSAEPPARKTPAREAPKLDQVRGLIDGMLRVDLDAPRKQRHTARRVLARLVDEHGIEDVSYSTVRDYVARRRPEIWEEAGRGLANGFVPQTHLPAAEGEVDFADLWVDLRGQRTKTHLFTMRLSFSGKGVHQAFGTEAQEAFMEGHEYAFNVFGGVPTERIRYDNLTSAVTKVLFGRSRVESQRWVTFRSHYGFDAFYCNPGIDGAHEKGGVEGEGGYYRRNHLVPVPKVDSLAELNERLVEYDLADERRRIGHRVHTVGHDFALEAEALRALPAERFETGLVLTPRVDRYAQVTVRQRRYSVPARFIGRRVRTVLRASEVVMFDRGQQVARHERIIETGGASLNLDHYLEILARKPGALAGATALVQARSAGTFTATHEEFWTAARRAHGDSMGTRILIEVLLLHRHHHADHVIAGMRAALTLAAPNSDLVAVETRRHGHHTTAADPVVVEFPTRPTLPVDLRPLPSVADYDTLLTGTEEP